MKIKSIHYSRNGVMGEPFFTVFYHDAEPDYGNMIATFTTEPDTSVIIRGTCRVVSIDNPTYQYRCDVIAINLQKKLNEMVKELPHKPTRGLEIYSLTTNYKVMKA